MAGTRFGVWEHSGMTQSPKNGSRRDVIACFLSPNHSQKEPSRMRKSWFPVSSQEGAVGVRNVGESALFLYQVGAGGSQSQYSEALFSLNIQYHFLI